MRIKKRTNPTRDRVQKYYLDKANLRRPGIREVARALNVNVALVHRYIKLLSTPSDRQKVNKGL